jgi:hypothetical protein
LGPTIGVGGESTLMLIKFRRAVCNPACGLAPRLLLRGRVALS